MRLMPKYRKLAIVLFLVVYAAMSLFPFYWNLLSAFTPVSKIFSYPPPLIPKYFTTENFFRLEKYFPYYIRNILNSFLLAFFTPLISIIVSSMAGYVFAKFQFFGRKVLFIVVMATLLIPTTSAYIPLFMEMVKFRMVDTYWAILLPSIASPFGVFIFRQSIFSIPDEIIDSARIDGASSLAIYTRLILPLIRPILVTIYISGFIGSWNEYIWPFIILSSEIKLTFPVVLASIQGQIFEAPWGIIMVGGVILTLPTLVIFMALSKYIVPDIFGGGIKG